MFGEVKGLTKSGWIAALPCGVLAFALATQSAQAGNYYDVLAGQTPLLHFGFNETVNPQDTSTIATEVDNLDLLLGAGNFAADANLGIDTVVGVASLEPSSGFDGFDAGNTGFNFNTLSGNCLVMSLTNPLNSMGMSAGSFSTWVRSTDPSPDGLGTAGMLYLGDEGGGEVMNVRFANLPDGSGVFTIELSTDDVPTIYAETDGTTDYSDGEWHHVVATWGYDGVLDSGFLNIYVDGGDLAGGEQDTATFDSISFPNIWIGDEIMDFDYRQRMGKGRANAMRYNGDMDESALWNRVLTAEEVKAQYDAAFAVGGLDGDLDGDGFVGLDDLDIILRNWNLNVPPGDAAADPTGDGYVGLEDLDIVLNHWNEGTPSSAVVPEPAALSVLGLGGLVLIRRNKR